MDVDTVVLAAATAVVGVAQLGIVMTARTKTAGDVLYVAIPTLAVWQGGALKKAEPGARVGAQLDAFVADYL